MATKRQNIPSLRDIRQACEEIRDGWTQEERARRRQLAHTRRMVLFGTLRIAQLEGVRVA